MSYGRVHRKFDGKRVYNLSAQGTSVIEIDGEALTLDFHDHMLCALRVEFTPSNDAGDLEFDFGLYGSIEQLVGAVHEPNFQLPPGGVTIVGNGGRQVRTWIHRARGILPTSVFARMTLSLSEGNPRGTLRWWGVVRADRSNLWDGQRIDLGPGSGTPAEREAWAASAGPGYPPGPPYGGYNDVTR